MVEPASWSWYTEGELVRRWSNNEEDSVEGENDLSTHLLMRVGPSYVGPQPYMDGSSASLPCQYTQPLALANQCT
jgi:hypothetical protein